MSDWKKLIDEMDVVDDKKLKELMSQPKPKYSPEFEDWFSRVIGKGFNFTPKELAQMKVSMTYSIGRWRVKGLIGESELPDTGGKLVWGWKMYQDKEKTIQMVKAITRYVKNYSRRMFGLKDGGNNEVYIAHYVNEMMKEGMPIRYPDQELIDKFFKGDPID